eukprot:211541-Ditylum_brightwellii.AAC.1
MSIRNTGGVTFPATASVYATPRGSTNMNVGRQHQQATKPLEKQQQSPSSFSQEEEEQQKPPQTAISMRGYFQNTNKREGALEIQGCGALKTWSIIGNVQSATVEIESEGRPVKAIVELWQGPNNVQQVAQIFSQDGYNRPYSMEVDVGDSAYGSSTIAIRNVGPMEYPFFARVLY